MAKRKTYEDHAYWILTKMGKKVLRPGGKKLTLKLIETMDFQSSDDVVELAPGTGFTAQEALRRNPHSYVGVELNEESAERLRKKFPSEKATFIVADASHTTLSDNSRDKLFGEAMLTMHADHRKSQIIKEAARILKPGGLYGIHELCLSDEKVDEVEKKEIQRGMSSISKVNTRPLTLKEWSHLIEQEGFEVVTTEMTSMRLLEIKRLLDDEGWLNTLRIGVNMLTHPKERHRIIKMRAMFRRYREKIKAVMIVSRKRV